MDDNIRESLQEDQAQYRLRACLAWTGTLLLPLMGVFTALWFIFWVKGKGFRRFLVEDVILNRQLDNVDFAVDTLMMIIYTLSIALIGCGLLCFSNLYYLKRMRRYHELFSRLETSQSTEPQNTETAVKPRNEDGETR